MPRKTHSDCLDTIHFSFKSRLLASTCEKLVKSVSKACSTIRLHTYEVEKKLREIL